jgi:hypothetical protein
MNITILVLYCVDARWIIEQVNTSLANHPKNLSTDYIRTHTRQEKASRIFGTGLFRIIKLLLLHLLYYAIVPVILE